MKPDSIQNAKLAPGAELESDLLSETQMQQEILLELRKELYRLRRESQLREQILQKLRRDTEMGKQRLQRIAGALSKGPRHLEGLRRSEPTITHSQINLPNSEDKACSSTSENFTAQSIRMATFRRCTCQMCPTLPSGKTHLSIKTTAMELRKENGVAISYTWGQFDRTKHCIGHLESHPAEGVWLELGAEWRVDSVLERLAQFTEKYGACWIDQICFPQKSDQLRRSLAQVPAVFRTLPVIILCPGSLCSCLRKAYQATWEKAPANPSNVESPADGTVYTYTTAMALFNALHAGDCLNSNGACSWPSRIWTNQEFRSARSVTMVYTEVEDAECCFRNTPLQTQLEKMSNYSRLLHRDLIRRLALDDREALKAVRSHHADFAAAFFGTAYRGTLDDTQVAALLLGETQVTASEHAAWDTYDSIKDEINSVMGRRLSASQPKDYVLSLFAESDFYVAPPAFQDLPTNMLLKDLLRQLRNVQPVLIPTRCPAGLFGINNETWSFDASDVTSGRQIEDIRHVYGVFEWWDNVDSQTPSRLPIRRLESSGQSCASKAPSLASWLARHDTMTGFVWFYNALSLWGPEWFTRLYGLTSSIPSMARLEDFLSSDDASEQIQGCRACLISVASAVQHVPLYQDTRTVTDAFLDVASHQRLSELARNDLQHLIEFLSATEPSWVLLVMQCLRLPLPVLEEAVFELICEVLFLDVKLCRDRGVRAILGEWHPHQDQARVPDPGLAPDLATSENKDRSNYGLAETQEYSNDVHDGSEQQGSTDAGSKTCIGLVHWETFCQARAQQQDTMTIALRRYPHVPFYEAVRTSGCGSSDSTPEYKVFGIWAPLDPETYRVANIGAVVVDEDKADAFVV
ncbi:hypothetical protein PV04_09501 [Phialophora macrospora]|uniref:Heterokaryon incompatibility domain-containing protein n=1 Tax=Phialophora macrospora TaxID=1851006 RepID=A0A0D2CH95_9EURO|nr:hypothetical protein PV04_09501 [Phialophora macrospora]